MVVFTSICANYLHKARTLARSVKDCMPDATFIVCLLERVMSPHFNNECFDDIVLAKDAWEGNFDRFIFKHSIVEASTSVKGQFFKYIYSRYRDENEFVYLDPDIFVYSDLIELREKLKTRPIMLCPHLLQPGNIDMELSCTAHGVYNLGFLAVNGSVEARRFINWWAERLYLFCYDDIPKGIFTDQKWVDLAPCFFDVEIFKHKGYDFAPWSLLNCEMSAEGGNYFVGTDPLRFIHFSGYGESAEKCMREWLPEGSHPFRDIYARYSEIHDMNDHDGISKTPWSYDFYSSGDKVGNAVRAAYRQNYEVMFAQENPFQFSDSYFKKKLFRYSRTSTSKFSWYLQRIGEVLREEGLIKLVVRVWNAIIKSVR